MRNLILTIALCLAWTCAFAEPDRKADAPVSAASALIYDMDSGAILFEQNADAPIPPASVTKVMSMFLALDHIKAGKASLDDEVVISKEAAFAGGSAMGLRPGESVPLEKLLMGMAVSSGNDASHAVAEFIGGSVEKFVEMMNDRAKELGMTSSLFLNPHGLPADGQKVTARDLMALGRAYLKAHPDSLRFHNTRTLEHRGYKSWNKNPLLGQYQGADGLKTGWIRSSGHNMIFTAERGGKRLLGVILRADDAVVRGGEACRLLDAGFALLAGETPTFAAALEANPLDLQSVDIFKTPREAGIALHRPINNKRLLATRRELERARAALRAGKGRTYTSSLPQPRSVGRQKVAKTRIEAGKKLRPVAKKKAAPQPKRKTHASAKQKSGRRS